MATKTSKLTWQADAHWNDGTAFGAADFVGFTLYIDGAPGVSVPRAWEVDGDYEMDLVAIAPLAAYGQHTISMTTVGKTATGAVVESPHTANLVYTVDDARVPKSPFGLSVA